jgi:hypothetical protein
MIPFRSLLLSFVLLSGTSAIAGEQRLSEARRALIDAHALAAPAAVEQSISALRAYLTSVATDDLERTRAIYRWVTDRIVYDVASYLAPASGQTSATPADVLASRSSICDGYASLFAAIARDAGLEVAVIKGFAKGYKSAMDAEPNHAWNAVRIEGNWKLFDPTWGAGRVRADRYEKAFSEFFFMAPPEQLMFSHLPVDPSWQLQRTETLSKEQFQSIPDLEASFFNIGFDGVKVLEHVRSEKGITPLVRTYDLPFHLIEVKEAPLTQDLPQQQTNRFTINSKAFDKMIVVHNDRWQYFQRDGETFTTEFAPATPGDIIIVGKYAGEERFTGVLGYRAN